VFEEKLFEGDSKLRGVRRVLLGLFSAAVIFTPICLGPFIGTSELQTNSGVERPSPSLDFGYPGNMSRWLAEHAVLKNQAIRLDGEIDRLVFGEEASAGSVSPRVIEGRAGVAFIADAFNEACNAHIETSKLIERLKMFSEVIRKSGREFNLIVSPDKSTVLSDFLPPKFDLKDCFESYNKNFWMSLENSDIRGFINLRNPLVDARTNRRELLFKRRDTHWDNAGGLVAAKTVVDSLAPGIWEEKSVSFSGLVGEVGDLDVISGGTEVDQVPSYSLQRPRDVVVKSESVSLNNKIVGRKFHSESESSSLISGNTLIFGDSFSEASEPFYLSYFENVTLVRLHDFSPELFMKQIKLADRVIVWSVERSFAYRVAYDWGTVEFINSLASELDGG
jgi:alginate O-acetyltransferase complex protein AlgJ